MSEMTVIHPVVNVLEANARPVYITDEQRFEQESDSQKLRQTQQKKYRALRDIKAADGSTIRKGDHFDAVRVGGHPNAEILAQRGYASILTDEEVRKKIEALTAKWIADPAGPAITLPIGVTEPGSAVTEETCAYVGDTRTVYDDSGNAKQVPLGPRTTDGRELLQQLIAAGRVVPGPGHKGTSRKASKKVTAP